MSKVFDNGSSLNKKILDGVTKLANNVKTTMGPRGKNVILHAKGKNPIITKDGVTVAEAIELSDPFENVGAQIIKQVARQSAASAGDGPQPLWSKILTPSGFVEMGNIRAGMKICGTNGTIQEVVAVYEKGEKEIYEVSLTEGRTVECCSEHLWAVTTNYGSEKTLTTKELMQDYKSIQQDGSSKYKYYTPKTEIEYGNNIDLPLDPYLVGVLLGDGSLGDSGTIELSLGLTKEHLLSKLNLPAGISAKTAFISEKNYFRVKLLGKTNDGLTIREFIEKIGLKNSNSETKFIPEAYLLSTKNNRLALLQGLIDTDGYVNERGYFEFSTVSAALAKDFAFLARSLGISLHIRKHERKENDGSYSDKSIFRITELKGDRFGNKILDIKPTGRFTQMKCIKVSNPDNLYITDNFIVTHNTTTATVLAHSILVQAQPFLAAGISPIDLKRGIDKAVEFFVGELPRWSRPVSDEQDLERVATISANGDKSIGKLIAKAVDLVGKDGSILIQEAKSMQTSLDIVEGFRFDSGFASSQFVTNERKGIMSYNEPYFLITDERIEAVEQLLPVLEVVARESKPLIIIAEEIEGQALAALIMNTLRGTMAVAAIKAPRYGEERRNILGDLAVSLGATFFTRLNGGDIRSAKLKDLGKAKSIECSKVQTIIMGGKGDSNKIQERIAALKEEVASSADLDSCKSTMERITRLASGIAVINVGAATEVEMIEKKHRIEDALEAVKSALDEGIVPGSGITLAKLAKQNRLHVKVDFEAEKYGVDIVVKACQQPLKTIVENAGGKPDVVLAQALDIDEDVCYDVVNERFIDAYEAGIIDPVKVTRCALQNAASAAGTLITTDHAVVDL